MITLKQDQFGLWSVPDLIDLDPSSGKVVLDRTIFPEASRHIVFGRGLGVKHLAHTLEKPPSGVLAVVGASSCQSQGIREFLEKIAQTASNVHIYKAQGHADHKTIRGGIETLHRVQADQLIVIGGGTTLDVGKAIAGLADQEDGRDIAAFQTGEKTIDPKRALPWIAAPTTSGTGSESTNNAVVELDNEKRSIRRIPPPAMIIADPIFTDSLPLSYTIVSMVDALAQSLEVITHAKASPEAQAVSLAAFLNLTVGLKSLVSEEGNEFERRALLGKYDLLGDKTALLTASDFGITSQARDALSWGSLLMGIAFAHAGLGLPHALAHFCMKFGISHGHMVGILLTPGLWVQARHNPATALRLQRVERALTASEKEHTLSLSFEEEATIPSGFESRELLRWLKDSISELFGQVGLPTSLSQAGLSLADLSWIASEEHALGESFGIPKRKATKDELMEALKEAY